MKPDRIFETVLYAEDLHAAEAFYQDVLGLEVLKRSDVVLSIRCGGGVLLIFDPDKSASPGRSVPSHGSKGPAHLAFGIGEEDLEPWRKRLIEKGVEIETEVRWESGGTSIYFRDPAGNSIELAPPTLWGGGWSF
jgi:catechol-2,3-dioxygenase